MATRLSNLFQSEDLLPSDHVGGRNGLPCDFAVHGTTLEMHKGWEEGKCVAMLSLDVSGAFDNASQPRMIHELWMMRPGGK